MIVTFCGHSDFTSTKEYEEKLLKILEEKVGDNKVDFYLGGYGFFDFFARNVCEEFKKTHKNATLVFVSPYLSTIYTKEKGEYLKDYYDEIIVADIGRRPPKYAIVYCNKWMVDKADLVISYIERSWGGAVTTFSYAKKKGKELINLYKRKVF